MTAALSHEMRTPLARVRFAAAVLEGEVDEPLRGQLRAVNADVQQIDDLISDMLDYARLDHPGLRMNCQVDSARAVAAPGGRVVPAARESGQHRAAGRHRNRVDGTAAHGARA